jgi:hypothetical protein
MRQDFGDRERESMGRTGRYRWRFSTWSRSSQHNVIELFWVPEVPRVHIRRKTLDSLAKPWKVRDGPPRFEALIQLSWGNPRLWDCRLRCHHSAKQSRAAFHAVTNSLEGSQGGRYRRLGYGLTSTRGRFRCSTCIPTANRL